MELNEQNINEIFNNSQNGYYGHGTNGNMEKINSILNIGLRCSHGSLYYTSCALGVGGEIDADTIDMLNNWPHLEAKKIVIVSLPIKYNIFDSPSINTYNLATNAFCYKIDGKGIFVMPQFIVGWYDADTKTFNKNDKYYELLPKEEKDKLLEQVKANYAQTIEDACGLEYYKEVVENLPGWEFPLTDEEISTFVPKSDEPKMYI